jgi:type 1 fimbriae regulatory protein FimE
VIKAAKEVGRHCHRDSTLILIAFHHGLRVSELVALRWDQVELDQGRLHVHRLKGGTASMHPLRGPELRALRRLRRDYPGDTRGYAVSVRARAWRSSNRPHGAKAR